MKRIHTVYLRFTLCGYMMSWTQLDLVSFFIWLLFCGKFTGEGPFDPELFLNPHLPPLVGFIAHYLLSLLVKTRHTTNTEVILRM